jgi:hypothetical protein
VKGIGGDMKDRQGSADIALVTLSAEDSDAKRSTRTMHRKHKEITLYTDLPLSRIKRRALVQGKIGIEQLTTNLKHIPDPLQ